MLYNVKGYNSLSFIRTLEQNAEQKIHAIRWCEPSSRYVTSGFGCCFKQKQDRNVIAHETENFVYILNSTVESQLILFGVQFYQYSLRLFAFLFHTRAFGFLWQKLCFKKVHWSDTSLLQVKWAWDTTYLISKQ